MKKPLFDENGLLHEPFSVDQLKICSVDIRWTAKLVIEAEGDPKLSDVKSEARLVD